MASLNGWSIDKFGNLSNGEYYVRPLYDRHSEFLYSCRLPNGKRKEYKSLHGAVLSINKLVEKGGS